MAPSVAPLLRRGTVCRSCVFAFNKGVAPIQRRTITQAYLKKKAEAMLDWDKRAEEVKAGTRPNFWDMLEERGYVKDTAGSRETIRELMRLKRTAAYVGIDPSASSLHVGHLLPLMPLFWMYMHGYGAYILLGGSTVKVGDPSGRTTDREPYTKSELAMNLTKVHFQSKKLWANVEAQARRYGYQKEWAWKRGLVNNNTWWNSVPLLEVLKRVGRYMRIGPLLSRDTVKRKMTEGNGVSFAEFTYPIMQGWDWWTLFQQQGVQMQIGGSDQYGNIVTGIEIVKAARDSETHEADMIPCHGPIDEPVGFTVPLLTDSAGVKFGKSAGNAVWLDQFMTTAFDLYGYFVRRPDADVEQLLKLFTFMPLEAIQKVMAEQLEDPSKRVAQHCLAYEVLTLVHGEELAKEAQEQHRMMYAKGGPMIPLVPKRPLVPKGPLDEYAPPEGPLNPNNAPRIDMVLPASLIMGKSIGRILFAAGLASSATEGHRLAQQQAAYVGGLPGRRPGQGEAMDPSQLTWNPIKLWFPQETEKYLIDGKLLILRKGKHNVRIIEMVPDEEYELTGNTYPGQPYTGRLRYLQNFMIALKNKEKTPEQVRQEMQEHLAKDRGPAKMPQRKNWLQKKIETELEEMLVEQETGVKRTPQPRPWLKRFDDDGSERPAKPRLARIPLESGEKMEVWKAR